MEAVEERRESINETPSNPFEINVINPTPPLQPKYVGDEGLSQGNGARLTRRGSIFDENAEDEPERAWDSVVSHLDVSSLQI